MKKIIFIICCVVCGISSGYGLEMCSASDNLIVVLDPSINGSSYSKNESAKTWQTKFSYGAISGIASCNETSGGSMGKTTTTEMSQKDTGKYCWCKMISPAVSLWTFYRADSSASDCASSCAHDCGYYARYDSGLRGGLFGSVAK